MGRERDMSGRERGETRCREMIGDGREERKGEGERYERKERGSKGGGRWKEREGETDMGEKERRRDERGGER